jgi:hypothetical protein
MDTRDSILASSDSANPEICLKQPADSAHNAWPSQSSSITVVNTSDGDVAEPLIPFASIAQANLVNADMAGSLKPANSNARPKNYVDAEMAESLMPTDPNARPKNFRTTFEECVFVFTVMMCSASTTFLQGVTIINTATIGKDLNMTAAQITWISASLGYEPSPPVLHGTDMLSVSLVVRSYYFSERQLIFSAAKPN